MLVDALLQKGIKAIYAHEPTNLPAGLLIRSILEKKVKLTYTQSDEQDWRAMALLFAADRRSHCNLINEHLDKGTWVVSDRYLLSSLAYQLIGAEDSPFHDSRKSLEWLRIINEFAIPPHMTYVLQVSPEWAKERRAARGGEEELFEADAFQERVAAHYLEAKHLLPESHETMQVVGEYSIKEVHKVLLQQVKNHLGLAEYGV